MEQIIRKTRTIPPESKRKTHLRGAAPLNAVSLPSAVGTIFVLGYFGPVRNPRHRLIDSPTK